MNSFDSVIIGFMNGFSRHSFIFDKLIVAVARVYLFKGGFLIGLCWWLWFKNTDKEDRHTTREHIIATLIICPVALFAARTLALTLPFRPRPIHNPDINFVLPYGLIKTAFSGWSSFPSDHAVLFLTLAFSFWFISKKLGFLVTTYVVAIICVPRVYLGLHYPTDILAGAVLGILFALIFNFSKIRSWLARPFLYLMKSAPGLFYFIFFLASYQIAILFDDVRYIGEKILKPCLKLILIFIS